MNKATEVLTYILYNLPVELHLCTQDEKFLNSE